MQLWEILIPASDNKGNKFKKRHHNKWDKQVIAIVNGLTLWQISSGLWKMDDGKYLKESMIVVRIAGTKEQIDKIIDLTAKHYEQKAVMVYKISDDVIIKHFK